ncbi:MAG: Uma2 family endonuclease [Nitriliruptor sp.]|uniref:Uma2 family endonuclease n=1 Tax=Nitriliruptor sp. TaxID=2448056 RepID=UPI0034A02142
MSVPTATGLTYDDLQPMPQDDGLRRELIDGELFVSPSPVRRHQLAVMAIGSAFHTYVRAHGGLAFPAPMDVVFAPGTVVEPDVVVLGSDRAADLRDERFIDVVPDLVVEVSSPSTRRLDLIKKRRLYEREGVPEYWFVDLDADVVDVHRLDETAHYGDTITLDASADLTCLAFPDLRIPVRDALAR